MTNHLQRIIQAAQGTKIETFEMPVRDFLGGPAERALTVGNFSGGGALVPTSTAEMFPVLRQYSALFAAGARAITATANQAMPYGTSGTSGAWLAEGASVSASDLQVAQLGLTPKRLSIQTKFTKQLAMQSNVEEVVKRDQNAEAAYQIDLAGLSGLGGSEPLGLLYNSLVPTITYGGAATTDKLAEAEETVANNFGENPASSLAWVVSPGTRRKWRQIPTLPSGSLALWQGNKVLGQDGYVSKSVTGNRSIYGDFTKMVVVFFGPAIVTVNPFSEDSTGTVRVTTDIYADVAPINPAFFVVSTDAANQ